MLNSPNSRLRPHSPQLALASKSSSFQPDAAKLEHSFSSRSSAPAGNPATDLLSLLNRARRRVRAKPLRWNAQLASAAQSHATDMAVSDYFSHTGANGSSSDSRIAATGYRAFYTTENIAGGQATARSAFNAFMSSPAHKANMLNRSLSEVGIGFFFNPTDTGVVNYRYYWVQNFAAR